MQIHDYLDHRENAAVWHSIKQLNFHTDANF